MRIMTFNCNGVRAAAKKGFFDWLPNQNVDVVCLQETKAGMEPEDDVKKWEYLSKVKTDTTLCEQYRNTKATPRF